MCSYREKKAEPQELLQLDGYTVDYTDPQPGTGAVGLLLRAPARHAACGSQTGLLSPSLPPSPLAAEL